jgi:hypothetical protein
MRSLPAAIQSAYADLLQAHLNLPVFEFDGAPFKLKRGNKTYWYAKQRSLGSAPPRQRYLGPDTEEMAERIGKMQAQVQTQADFRSNCSSIVAQLRAGGVPGLDRQSGATLRALHKSGVFRLGGTLAGTHAFRHYDLELGFVLTPETPDGRRLTQTEDIDIASFERLSTAIDDRTDPDLAASLTDLGFQPRNALEKSTSWRHAQSSFAIDFLTPSFEESEAPRKLAALNIWAYGLHFLDFLIKDPIPAVSLYMEGILVQVPRPERYAIHKLIVSQSRVKSSAVKARKDAQQARLLIAALSEIRPYELQAALAEADQRGPSWRNKLDQALDLRFNAPPLTYDSSRDIVWFDGTALTQKHRCMISGEALEDHFNASAGSASARVEALQSNRAKIEDLMRRKFRAEPSAETLLTTNDVEAFRKSKA